MISSKIPMMCRIPYNYIAQQRVISDNKIEEYSILLLNKMHKTLPYPFKEIKNNEQDVLQELKLFLLILNTEDFAHIEFRFALYCTEMRDRHKRYDEVNNIVFLKNEMELGSISDPEVLLGVKDEVKPIIEKQKNNLLNQDEYKGFINNYKISSPQSEYDLFCFINYANIEKLTDKIQSKKTQLIKLEYKDDIICIEFKPSTGNIVEIHDRLYWSRDDSFRNNLKEEFKNYLDNLKFWDFVGQASLERV